MNELDQYQAQFLQEVIPVVVGLAFIAMVILDVIKAFKEVMKK